MEKRASKSSNHKNLYWKYIDKDLKYSIYAVEGKDTDNISVMFNFECNENSIRKICLPALKHYFQKDHYDVRTAKEKIKRFFFEIQINNDNFILNAEKVLYKKNNNASKKDILVILNKMDSKNRYHLHYKKIVKIVKIHEDIVEKLPEKKLEKFQYVLNNGTGVEYSKSCFYAEIKINGNGRLLCTIEPFLNSEGHELYILNEYKAKHRNESRQ